MWACGAAQGPKADAAELLRKRFPVPRLVDCDQNGSQARGSSVCLASVAALKLPSTSRNTRTASGAQAHLRVCLLCCHCMHLMDLRCMSHLLIPVCW